MGFEIFSEGSDSGPASLAQTLVWMMDQIEQEKMTARDAVEVLCDIVRPGHSEHSHDVKPLWVGAMWAFGFGEVASQVQSMYLNSMPWGIGFAIEVQKDFMFEALSDEARLAVIKSMAIVLQTGGLNATVTDEHTIRVDLADGTTDNISTSDIVGQFREQIDKELGPDADPTRRWMP